jgi:hypothetical protein
VDWADVAGISNARRTNTVALVNVKLDDIALFVGSEGDT